MAQAFPNGVGSMAAVLGLSYEEVDRICKELSTNDELVEPKQTLIVQVKL